MHEGETRLFVGIKISSQLQRQLDHCARGTERYLKEDQPESLQIVTLGEDKLIGRFLRDGFPVPIDLLSPFLAAAPRMP